MNVPHASRGDEASSAAGRHADDAEFCNGVPWALGSGIQIVKSYFPLLCDAYAGAPPLGKDALVAWNWIHFGARRCVVQDVARPHVLQEVQTSFGIHAPITL